MRDSMKMTVPYQFGYVLVMHIAAVLISCLFQTVAFWYFIDKPVMKEILAVVFMAIYGGMIYLATRKMSVLDHKSYTPLKPSIFKSVMFGVMISVLTVVIYIVWKQCWINSAATGAGMGARGIIMNIVFTLWTFPYFGIMGTSNGMITVVSLIAMIILPIVAAVCGYVAGKHNFSLMEKIEQFSYEKEDE